MANKISRSHILDYKNRSIQLLIKKNKLSRNYKLTFDKKNLSGLVSIPKHVSFKSGLDFANQNKDWLYKEMNKFYPLIYIGNNTLLEIGGKKMKVFFKTERFFIIRVTQKEIIISSKKNDHKKVLKKWLSQQMLHCSRKIIDHLSKELKVNIKEVKLSNSFNYWGSCNTNGVIHLNWRLIFSPIDVINYIIAHEICHLKEFNHTDKFWKLVKKVCPNYKEQIKWLKKNDNYLYRLRI